MKAIASHKSVLENYTQKTRRRLRGKKPIINGSKRSSDEDGLLPLDDPRIAPMAALVKPRQHWPKDFALNHAHYVKGHPKKS